MENDALIIPGCWALQDLQPFIEDFGDDNINNDLIGTPSQQYEWQQIHVRKRE